jgi:hypothetical protein
MKKKQALTIVKNNRIQNSKNYRKGGKGSYGAPKKKMEILAKKTVK